MNNMMNATGGLDGRRNVVLAGDRRIAGSPAGRGYPQAVQKIRRARHYYDANCKP